MKFMSLVSSLVTFLSFDVVNGEINYNLLLNRCKRSLLIPSDAVTRRKTNNTTIYKTLRRKLKIEQYSSDFII